MGRGHLGISPTCTHDPPASSAGVCAAHLHACPCCCCRCCAATPAIYLFILLSHGTSSLLFVPNQAFPSRLLRFRARSKGLTSYLCPFGLSSSASLRLFSILRRPHDVTTFRFSSHNACWNGAQQVLITTSRRDRRITLFHSSSRQNPPQASRPLDADDSTRLLGPETLGLLPVMDRSQSEDHIAFGPITPWANDTFSRRTHRGESEPAVPAVQRSRPSRGDSVKASRPTKRSVTQRSNGSSYRATPPPEDTGRQSRAHGSFSAQTTPRPYETPFLPPSVAQAAPSPPPCYNRALPATPPESFSEKSSQLTEKSTEKTTSPSSKQVINFLPGTMSARNVRSRASSKQRPERPKKKPAKVKRWKVVFREMFTKTPVDETQFERIEDRHWTDE